MSLLWVAGGIHHATRYRSSLLGNEEVIAEAKAKRDEEKVEPDQFQDPDDKYGLIARTVYEAEDKGAGGMYKSVDDAMDQRRKARREVKEREDMHKVRAEWPKIQQQFADLKRALSSLTDEEWECARKEDDPNATTWVVQDMVLVGDRIKTEYESSLEMRGIETPAGTLDLGTLTKFVEIGDGRVKILSLKLDQLSSCPATPISSLSSPIDPKGYPTTLDTLSSTLKISAEIRDTSRARMLFDGSLHSNPKHAPGLSSCRIPYCGGETVRLEFGSVQLGAGYALLALLFRAREIIREGCEHCKTNDDVWLEAARLHVWLKEARAVE
ncbi:PRP1 splicing factor, N-terminal-domain-containing protein [Coprinopsis sp. MPI-PUGE-AT-0042]|nr:PRP1 splicing factor, N-terminal-domain-containing protein [Coprinopsis sp. MPI-PUGE-AT-0042]